MSRPARHADPTRRIGIAILTVSDTRGPESDESGALVQSLAEAAGHRIHARSVVPDDPQAVRERIEGWLSDEECEAILVTGGTGISARDRTCEAVGALLDLRLDGYGEIFRTLSFREIGAKAMLSRAIAGVARRRLLFTMPGSPGAVRLAMESLILPVIGHAVSEANRPT